jgi:hypothetical protein
MIAPAHEIALIGSPLLRITCASASTTAPVAHALSASLRMGFFNARRIIFSDTGGYVILLIGYLALLTGVTLKGV